MELDVGLHEFRSRGESRVPYLPRALDRPPPRVANVPSKSSMGLDGAVRQIVFRCFRCNQVGHRAAECPLPPPKMPGPQTPIVGEKPQERGRLGLALECIRLAAHIISGKGTTSGKDGGNPGEAGEDRLPEEHGGSDEDDPNDSMVSDPVRPFIIPVVIRNTHMGEGSNQGALIDSGCTRCLIQRSVVTALAIRVVALRTPIQFEQMDGSVLGGTLATRH